MGSTLNAHLALSTLFRTYGSINYVPGEVPPVFRKNSLEQLFNIHIHCITKSLLRSTTENNGGEKKTKFPIIIHKLQ